MNLSVGFNHANLNVHIKIVFKVVKVFSIMLFLRCSNNVQGINILLSENFLNII